MTDGWDDNSDNTDEGSDDNNSDESSENNDETTENKNETAEEITESIDELSDLEAIIENELKEDIAENKKEDELEQILSEHIPDDKYVETKYYDGTIVRVSKEDLDQYQKDFLWADKIILKDTPTPDEDKMEYSYKKGEFLEDKEKKLMKKITPDEAIDEIKRAIEELKKSLKTTKLNPYS